MSALTNGRTGDKSRLNGKQSAFVAAYLMGASGAAAAMQAGYSPKSGSARAAAYRLLHKVPSVMAAVKAGQQQIQKAAEVTAESMMQQLAMTGRSPSRPRTPWPR
jgi:phage terminase small subunit